MVAFAHANIYLDIPAGVVHSSALALCTPDFCDDPSHYSHKVRAIIIHRTIPSN